MPGPLVGTYEVTRVTGGDFGTGVFKPYQGATKIITVLGSHQPLRGNELLRFEEGDRKRERKKFYTNDQLQSGDESKNILPDEITIDGVVFQVETVEPWPSYFKAILVRKDLKG